MYIEMCGKLWYSNNVILRRTHIAITKGNVKKMVDLRAKPYYLNDEDIAWVESTITGMSDEETVDPLSALGLS